jgi:hypothetical protein
MNSSSLMGKSNKRVASLLGVFGAVLLLMNFLLVQQNKKLKVLASRPDRALEIRPGSALPPLEGVDSNGNRLSINYGQDSRKTVLLILSPKCLACEENMPNWEAIINGLDHRSFRLVAISLQPLSAGDSARRHGLDRVPILTKFNPKYRVAYNLALTPQIILIRSDGIVERVWTGVLREEDKLGVETALNVRLP